MLLGFIGLLGLLEFVGLFGFIEFVALNSKNTGTPQHFVTQHVNLINSLTY